MTKVEIMLAKIKQKKAQLAQMKKDMKDSAYKQHSASLLDQIRQEVLALNAELRDEVKKVRESIQGIEIPKPPAMALDMVVKTKDGKQIIDEDFLRQLPLLEQHFKAQLASLKTVDEYRQAFSEVTALLRETPDKTIATALHRVLANEKDVPAQFAKSQINTQLYENLRSSYIGILGDFARSENTQQLIASKNTLKAELQRLQADERNLDDAYASLKNLSAEAHYFG
jgi:hypothetical protein